MLKTAQSLPDHRWLDELKKGGGEGCRSLVKINSIEKKILHQEANMVNVHLPLPEREEGINLCILPHLQRSAI